MEPKVLALLRERFLWRFLYLERIQGVLDGMPRGPVGPPGPLELAALVLAGVRAATTAATAELCTSASAAPAPGEASVSGEEPSIDSRSRMHCSSSVSPSAWLRQFTRLP